MADIEDRLEALASSLKAITDKQEAATKRQTSDKTAATKARKEMGDQIDELNLQVKTLQAGAAEQAKVIEELKKGPVPHQWPDVAAGIVEALKANPLMLVIGTCICFALAVGGITLHYTPALVLPQAPTPTPSVEKKE